MALLLSDLIDAPVAAQRDAAGLWLSPVTFTQATGFTLKPEGFCRDALCIPVPAGRASEFLRGDNINLRAFATHTNHVLVSDDGGEHWLLTESAAARQDQLDSGIAPDFAVADINGHVHRLSDYRGKKVLLASWASW